jgi:hypothetical protein
VLAHRRCCGETGVHEVRDDSKGGGGLATCVMGKQDAASAWSVDLHPGDRLCWKRDPRRRDVPVEEAQVQVQDE